MKNLKKVLSVALALAMALSLMTTAFAAVPKASDLTGNDKVGSTYTQAVDMMVGLGVIDGVSGDIQAQGNVTREQAAKIVCTMLLGSDASQLSTTSSYFSDVPATRWSAPYIAYCVENGIVSGVGGGKFNPTGNVTGTQFAKMLLVALGYKADVEGYTGTNWAVNVSGDATEAGIYKSAAALNKNAAATREQACLYAWNAVRATLVEYTNPGTSITIGDTSINVGGTKATPISSTTLDTRANIDGVSTPGSASYTVQFGEKYFTTLKKTNTAADDFGRPASAWKIGSTTVGTYNDESTLVATYTSFVKLGTIYSDIGLSATTATTAFYIDGVSQGNVSLVKGSTTYLSSSGRGVLTEVYYDDSADEITIVSMNTYVGEITRVVAATSSVDAHAFVSALGTGISGNYDTTDFAEDDIVLYTQADGDIQSLVKASSIDGELTSTTGTTASVVGGTSYSSSAKAVACASNYGGSLTDIVTLYTDAYGYAIYMTQSSAGSTNYAYVLAAGSQKDAYGVDTYYAKLLFADGTVQSVVTAKDYKTAGDNDLGGSKDWTRDVVTYTVNSTTNKYTLTDKTNADDDTTTTFALTKGYAGITLNTTPDPDTMVYANTNSVFVVITGTDAAPVYTVYTGIANVPTITGEVDYSYYAKTAGMVTFAVLDAHNSGASVTSSTSDVIFVLGSTIAGLTTDTNGTYYTFKAVINGEITTIKVDESVADPSGTDDLHGGVSALYNSVTYNSYGVATSLGKDGIVKSATGTRRTSGGAVGLGYASTAYYTYASDVNVYTVSDGALVASSVSSIGIDANDEVYYTYKDGEVTNIFIVPVTGTYTVATPSITTATAVKGITITKIERSATTVDAGGSVTYTVTYSGNASDDATITFTAGDNCTAPATLTHTITNGTDVTSGATVTFTVTNCIGNVGEAKVDIA